jgi:putative endonuclease
MPAIYILKSEYDGRFYVGSTLDLTKRLAEHHRGHSPYTKARGSWILAYCESYETLPEARQRERQTKSWKSHRSVQELIDTGAR